MCRHIAFIAALLVSSSAIATEAPRVSLDGFGVFRIGMSEHEVNRVSGSVLTRLNPDVEQGTCFYASVTPVPDGVDLMFLDGHLSRVDIFKPGIATVSGARIGTTERQLKSMYARRLNQQPHKYDWPVGHYLTLISSDRTRGLRFETDGSQVTAYYVGTKEAIQLAEGCQ